MPRVDKMEFDKLDTRLDQIDGKITKLIDSLEKIIQQSEKINKLTIDTKELHHRVNEHGKRITILEDHTSISKKRIKMLQFMSIGIFLIATAGAIAQFL